MRTKNEVLELLKRAKRQNDMVAILPDSDTSKVLIKVLEESTWILVDDEKKLPESGKYILLSFENFSSPMVGKYEGNKEDGGAFYVGDDTESCLTYGLFVNAWMSLPDPYRE